jgi:hypothetical protein
LTGGKDVGSVRHAPALKCDCQQYPTDPAH